ncbi:MAG: 4-hydroxyphenylpyruvate dioxygenase [Bdellovibrionales bacterium]
MEMSTPTKSSRPTTELFQRTPDMIVRKENVCGLDGMEFLEFASPDPAALEGLFEKLGFKWVGKHKNKNVKLFRQGRTNFILNMEPNSFSENFYKSHGPSICATGFRVKNSAMAFNTAIERGAKPCEDEQSHSFKSIYGIGESAINFVDKYDDGYKNYDTDFELLEGANDTEGFGLTIIDHMTNNVPVGEMDEWVNFYSGVFNFEDVRFFNIRGEATGLLSKVMRSPCNKITIPINEPTESKSQIQEYLDEYKGSGIQHVALLTDDIIESVSKLRAAGVEFLDVPDTYYDDLLDRVPGVTEDINRLRDLKILVDGDDNGYLLQIFTKNMIGPIFFEIIQRKNNNGFGEGNFQALFDAIERDQRTRGYLD